MHTPAPPNPDMSRTKSANSLSRFSVAFDFVVANCYNIEYTIQTDNSFDLRVWDTDDARPGSPTLSAPAVTPGSSGTNAWISKAGGAGQIEFDNALWEDIAGWSRKTFGSDQERGPIGPLKHLAKEANEAIAEPGSLVEYADCLIILFDATRRAGFSCQELVDAAGGTLTLDSPGLYSFEENYSYKV